MFKLPPEQKVKGNLPTWTLVLGTCLGICPRGEFFILWEISSNVLLHPWDMKLREISPMVHRQQKKL